MKKNMRKIELVGKSRVVALKYGHAFNVKPGFVVVTTHRNRYIVSFINDCSARFYQGTAGGGIVRVDIDTRAFARRFNIAENFVTEVLIPKMRERIWEWDSEEPSSEGFRYKNPESFDDLVLNVPRWIKPVEKLPPNWWRETLDTDTEE